MRISPHDHVDLVYYSPSHLRSLGEALMARLKRGHIEVTGLDQAALAAVKAGIPTAGDIIRLKEACRTAGV